MSPKLLANVAWACSALLSGAIAHAEDWTASNGRLYRDVHVLKVDPDAVTILYKDGGGLIPLEDLPANLQQRFHFDPLKAQEAADARAAADDANAKALAEEKAKAAAIKAQQDAQSRAAIKAAKARTAHHDGMPQEPAVLEANQKQNGDSLAPPR